MSGLIDKALDALLTDPATGEPLEDAELLSLCIGLAVATAVIVTMIFLPITFLTGYFGMNFAWLDNQLNSFGMWLFLGLAVPVVIVIVSAALLRSGGYSVPKLFKHRDNP